MAETPLISALKFRNGGGPTLVWRTHELGWLEAADLDVAYPMRVGNIGAAQCTVGRRYFVAW